MIRGEMQRKMDIGIRKVWKAIEDHGGTTLLSTGITGDDARMARAAVKAGARLLEPNHPSVILARGLYGVATMNESRELRYKLPLEEMLKVIRGVRDAVGEEVYITAGVPGVFSENRPALLTEEDFYNISLAGADGVHTHKTTFEDLEEVVENAHKYGLLVDSYIMHPDNNWPSGIPAETPEDVAKVAKTMDDIGVDLIGLMTGMSYRGVAAGDIHPVVKERLQALVDTIQDKPTLAEGGINLDNYQAFKGTGVKILVVGTSFDHVAEKAVAEAVKQYITLER